MDWDDYKRSRANRTTSARQLHEESKKNEQQEAIKKPAEYIKQHREDLKHEQKLQLEKKKEQNTWKRAFVTWTLNSIAIIVSIVALLFLY